MYFFFPVQNQTGNEVSVPPEVLCVYVWMKSRSSPGPGRGLQSSQRVSDNRLEETHGICEPGESHRRLRSALLAVPLCLTRACAMQRKCRTPNRELAVNSARNGAGSLLAGCGRYSVGTHRKIFALPSIPHRERKEGACLTFILENPSRNLRLTLVLLSQRHVCRKRPGELRSAPALSLDA